MQYKKYISEELNPITGVSRFFDINHYNSKGSYKTIIATASQKNYLVNDLKRETLLLKAYGLNNSDTRKVLLVYKPEFESTSKDAYSDIIARWCTYYSYHIDELKNILGNSWFAEAEHLLDYYLSNKDSKAANNKYLTEPITYNNCIKDIRNLLNKLILYAQCELPDEYNLKDLKEKEQRIKQRLSNCEDVEVLNDLYSELLSILKKKEQTRNLAKDSQDLKAIRVLKSCGFLEAAYLWLECFPNK